MTPSRVKRICTDSLLLVCALMLSYLESVLPLSLAIPIPGIKLGLSNIAVMLAFFAFSPADAAIVSFMRVLVFCSLFGGVTSFLFSFLGALFSFFGMWISSRFLKKYLSWYGISVMSAALHSVGQIAAAAAMTGSFAILSYLPVMLTASVFTGLVTGAVVSAVLKTKIFGVKNA